jgi:hypothetical protein
MSGDDPTGRSADIGKTVPHRDYVRGWNRVESMGAAILSYL